MLAYFLYSKGLFEVLIVSVKNSFPISTCHKTAEARNQKSPICQFQSVTLPGTTINGIHNSNPGKANTPQCCRDEANNFSISKTLVAPSIAHSWKYIVTESPLKFPKLQKKLLEITHLGKCLRIGGFVGFGTLFGNTEHKSQLPYKKSVSQRYLIKNKVWK